ncbi:MAG: Holliday junction resolvase RuvX [Methylotetracoccus sp.]
MPEPAQQAGATGSVTALGFDFGTKRIGVAVGQKLTGTARPLQTIRLASHGEPWRSIGSLIDTWRPDALVVGFAYPFDGGENPIASAMDQFCKILERRFGIPVHRVDETLSTAEARSAFHAGPRRRERFLDVKDELAAAVILQTWLCDY